MSKAVKKEEEQAVATVNPANLPVGLSLDTLQEDAGKGSQNVQATDTQTPIISILQANSPQCKKSDGKYIKGAEEGSLYNNVTGEVYSGEEGITVIPCFFEKVYIEWKPNRGGFVAIHGADTPLRDQVKMVVTAEGKEVPTLPNGNNLIETNQHYVLKVNADGSFEPAVIAMTSSALKASRQWNTLIKRVMLTGKNGPFNPASYYCCYKLSTAARQKDDYTWSSWRVESLGPVPNMDLYNAGKALEQAVNAGQVKVKQEQVVEGAAVSAVVDDEIPFD